MTIYLSDKQCFNPNDPYEKMMEYTTCIFGATEIDFQNISTNPFIKSRKVIWVENIDEKFIEC